MPSSRGSSCPGIKTLVSCIVGRFLTIWANREAPNITVDTGLYNMHRKEKCEEIQLLLLLLSRFSRVWLCATPQTAAHQAPQSLGFSRQEHWSGLPFPSPMHESEKWKWGRSVSFWLFVTPWAAAYQAPPSMGFSRQEYWSGVPLPSPIQLLVVLILGTGV